MAKKLHILLILNLWLISAYGQIDSAKYKSGCLVCESYKNEYHKGKVVKNILKSFQDTSFATISFEVTDYNGSPVPYSEITFKDSSSKRKSIYYTDSDGKRTIETKAGEYVAKIKGYFESDTITVSPILLKEGDIREIRIDVGESKCLRGKQYTYSTSSGRDYTIQYYTNFKNCFPPELRDGAFLFPPYPLPDSTISYWGNHQLQSTAYYTDCKGTGEWKVWYSNGKLRKVGKLINGKKEGQWKIWDQNGKIIEFSNHQADVPIGKQCAFYSYESSIVESYFEKNGAFKTSRIDLKVKEITTTHVSKKGFTTKQTKRPLKVDLDSYEYTITDQGDLILQKK